MAANISLRLETKSGMSECQWCTHDGNVVIEDAVDKEMTGFAISDIPEVIKWLQAVYDKHHPDD